jgi:hypothetical protein
MRPDFSFAVSKNRGDMGPRGSFVSTKPVSEVTAPSIKPQEELILCEVLAAIVLVPGDGRTCNDDILIAVLRENGIPSADT